MPDESCRYCGGELEDYLKCQICKKTTRFACCECSRKTSFQYHFLCNIGQKDPLIESIRNNLPVIKIALAA